MSATSLRHAAAIIRERANAADDGPWFSDLGEIYSTISREWIGETAIQGNANASHIATWHPGVAAAIAELLDAIAAEAESLHEYDGFDPGSTIPGWGAAAAVAQLIAGGAQ